MITGCEVPRIFTPPRRELTVKTTHGFACIAFAEEVLGIKLLPWQRWLLIHALEFDDDRLYLYRIVCVEVARQSGKTLVLLILALWHIYCLDSRMVIGTAQDLTRSEKSWAEAVEWALENDELSPLIEDIKRGHPKVLQLITGCEYRVATASRRGGRGFTGDLILLDELREHQSWDSWAAVTNTMNARPKAQAWAFSNAGDSLSVVLRYLRASAHRQLGWPDGDNDAVILEGIGDDVELDSSNVLGWFEWSAPPHAKRNDLVALAQANPSLNHTEITENCVSERALLSQLAMSPPHVFDMECMCRWASVAEGGPFPEGSWVLTTDAKASPAKDAKSAICVEVSPGKRERCFIARAALDEDWCPVLGIWADRQGTEWVVPWLIENRAGYSVLVLRSGAGSPARSLWDDFEALGLPVEKWQSADVSAAHGQLFDLLNESDKETGLKVRHRPHPGLDMAATSAAIKIQEGGAWIVDVNNSPTDTAPLFAAFGALWGLGHLPDDRPSIYAGAAGVDVMVL